MLILALDSTAIAASAALLENEKPLCSFQLENGNTHSETLLPMVKALFDVSGKTVNDVDLFAVSVGPGSFTGVRIGVATLKGLAFGKSKNVLGVSTLYALAENVMPANGLICPVMNARRNQVYNALFKAEGENLIRLTPDRALAIEELEEELKKYAEPVFLCGDGTDLVLSQLKSVRAVNAPRLTVSQNAVSVGICALRDCLAGKAGTDAELVPFYLRMPQAERERLAREENKN